MTNHNAALIASRLALTAEQRQQTRAALAQGKQAEPDRRRAQRYAFQQRTRQSVIVGDTNDLLPVSFLQQGITSARAVALIREDGVPKGSGFLTHGNLFITNHHLLPEPSAQGVITVQFGYRQSETGEIIDGRLYTVDADRFWLTSPTEEYDCTLIALGEAVNGSGEAPLPLSLNDRNDKHALGINLNLIHHPGGAPQQITLRNNALLARHEQFLHYEADSEGGSSGAPVFNDGWQLVALHHGGVEDNGKWVNEGIRLSALTDWLKGELPQLSVAMQTQLMQALTSDATPLRSVASAAPPDENYRNRDGFQADFLGTSVDIAAIIAPRVAEVAPLRDGSKGAEARLDYQHFSLLMSAERKLAFFTATNIDGASYINIDRDSGQPSLLPEGDRWYEDSRIDSRYVTGQAFYSEFSRWFDRGHLTRRSDPTWGSAAEAVRANKDTFHFTNCSPQHFRFNQSVQYWQGVERYILEFGVLQSKKRISVLTGPVLNDRSRQYADLQVPLMFWKVVLRTGPQGKPQATALLVSQDKLLDEPRRVLPRAQPETVPNVDEYRVSVSALETLTGLNFSAFRDWDSWQPDAALLAQPLPAKLIMTWQDLL
ncbi:DNA/RNA non-specific endonuclease [Pantoea sp. CCBC3-3-1]|uniref:DNA/RNA non-specific endonuclease n=1 Tax=Pantoea sp. CCBC3-3-1 TaxID=2490851 RepID=UPI0011BE10CC|nr:DNA/RNA non-specific endonuclease [Pantoea sp. CCBC3-3-1]